MFSFYSFSNHIFASLYGFYIISLNTSKIIIVILFESLCLWMVVIWNGGNNYLKPCRSSLVFLPRKNSRTSSDSYSKSHNISPNNLSLTGHISTNENSIFHSLNQMHSHIQRNIFQRLTNTLSHSAILDLSVTYQTGSIGKLGNDPSNSEIPQSFKFLIIIKPDRIINSVLPACSKHILFSPPLHDIIVSFFFEPLLFSMFLHFHIYITSLLYTRHWYCLIFPISSPLPQFSIALTKSLKANIHCPIDKLGWLLETLLSSTPTKPPQPLHQCMVPNLSYTLNFLTCFSYPQSVQLASSSPLDPITKHHFLGREFHHSSSGFCTKLLGFLVTWGSRQQKVVSKSTHCAEYIMLASAVEFHLFLTRIILSDFKSQVFCGNQALVLVVNDNRSKAELRSNHGIFFLFNDSIRENQIYIQWIPTKDKIANFLTKALGGSSFNISWLLSSVNFSPSWFSLSLFLFLSLYSFYKLNDYMYKG
ncbi:uncharacterized protein VP01_387g3 [Puccinia sorghi]|uniref:Uncharacterized protein n=1 Tax=Puccinia sorghi TaxID=27349 RepID=A0A0L6USW6_9BASI|nr:uncharacterized protein VP01_387g3 [Puccinia sorghi]